MNFFKELGLRGHESSAEVKEAWRKLASLNHPDKGGDPAEFDRLRKAYLGAIGEADERESRCTKCDGSGFIRVTQGFHTVMFACDECHGSGRK